MDIGYAVEKLTDTTRVLNASSFSIKERLKKAIMEGFFALSERDIPKEALKDFKSISERLKMVREAQNVFNASIDQMSEKEANQLATDIISLSDKVNLIWDNS